MIRNGFRALIIIASVLLANPASHADGQTGVALFPSFSLKQETGTLAGDTTALHLDIRLGFLTASGLYFGFLYSRTSTIGSNGINQSSYGNSVGYFYDYFSVIFTFFLTSTSHESSNTSRVTRSEGSGYQLDFSYMFPIGGMSIGPVLTYRTLTFGKEETQDGQIANHGQTESYVYPFFGALFMF